MDSELMHRFVEVAGLILAVLAAAGLTILPRRWLGRKAKGAEHTVTQ